ncbi:putative transcription factor ovo-like protein 3, partial [Taenia solium]|eukprot:TsM_000177000 transcript=TsM_000177000 gene=TsM_000177000
MLESRDVGLRYINDENVVGNSLAVSRTEKLKFLRSSFCKERAEGGYKCVACSQWRCLLQDMSKHLLCDSDSEFYLCVRCLRRFLQRSLLEGHQSSVHQVVLSYESNQRRVELRVCESCKFVCRHYATLLEHTMRQ